MRIKAIKIENMACFPTFQAELSAVVLIQGRNEAGKTSLVDSIKYAFARGHDPAMIHGTAEAGEILVTLDTGAQVRARAVRATNTTTRSYKAAGASRFSVGRAEIEAMVNPVSYDAMKFMTLSPREQVETLLRVMPIDVAPEKIRAALGGVVHFPSAATGLAAIEYAYDDIYKSRREVNLSADVQAKHATALDAALPPAAPDGDDWENVERTIREDLAEAESAERDGIAAIGKWFAEQKAAANRANAAAVLEIDTAINAEIAELERQRASRKEAARQECEQLIEAARKQANTEAGAAREECAPTRAKLTADLATATERARAQQQAAGTFAAAEKARAEAATLKTQADAMTAALDRLKALKVAITARLPIKGITIDGDGIKNTEGIPFGRWNEQTQISFCLRLAVLVFGEAAFICLDNPLGHLDAQHRKGLFLAAQKYAEQSGAQFIITTITDSPVVCIAEPKPGSKCPWCVEGMPMAPGGGHASAAGPIPCLEAGV